MKRVIKAERKRVGEVLRRRDRDIYGSRRDRFQFTLTLECGQEEKRRVVVDKGAYPPYPSRARCERCE